MSNPYSTWFNIESMELQHALMKASSKMGDNFIYLSSVGYSEVVDPNTPLNFKFPIEELLKKEIYLLKRQAEKLAVAGKSFFDVLIYSPQ